MQLGEPYSSTSDWRVKPERPGREDSHRDGNSAGDRRLRSGRRRRDRLGGRRDIHDSFPKGSRNSPSDAFLLAYQGSTVAKANANRHAQRNARGLEKREASTRQADARQAKADEAGACEAEAEAETREAEVREAEAAAGEAEAQGSTGTRTGIVEPPESHANRDASGKAESEPHGDSGAHAHGNANSDAKRGSDAQSDTDDGCADTFSDAQDDGDAHADRQLSSCG